MKKLLATVLAASLAVTLCACGGGSGDKGGSTTLPKSIEVQLPASAGGGTDVAGRTLVDYINKNNDTNLTIVNNTDGGGVVAYETIRTNKNDASKILFFHSTMIIKYATGLYDQSPADSFKVAAAGLPTEKGGYVLVVPADKGITDVDGFIEAAKAGELKIGVETGGSSHIMTGIMSKALGIELKIVEAGPDTEKLTALVGGTLDCALVNANQAKQYIEAGKVNALACFSATDEGGRNSVVPDVPSFPELGYTDCVFGTYFYVLCSPDTPDELAEQIHDMYAAAAEDADTKAILESSGFGLSFAPYEDGAGIMKAQQESLVSVCDELGLKQ